MFVIRRSADILRLDMRPATSREPELTLADIEAVRLILRGGSPVDWHRLNFQSRDQCDDLLRANLIDPDNPRDVSRVEYLHRESIRYLRRNFSFRFPVEVEEPGDVRDLLLYASEDGRMNRVQILSCVVLKTMHTINHIEARELLHETPISEVELIKVLEDQILERAHFLTEESGLPVIHFYGSRKSRDSLISKLLSKKASRASEILDRLRFRIVTETRADIVPVLAYTLRHVFPWNQVTANQSTNNLVNFARHLRSRPELSRYLPALQVDIGVEEAEAAELRSDNEFSGSSYRMINFIIEVPVRLDSVLGRTGDPWQLHRGSIVYVACEFQIVDQDTAYLNEQGENSHTSYKERQRRRVGERLMWGLMAERREGRGRRTRAVALSRKPRVRSVVEELSRSSVADERVRRMPRPPRPAAPASLVSQVGGSEDAEDVEPVDGPITTGEITAPLG